MWMLSLAHKMRTVVREAGIKDRDKQLHPTVSGGVIICRSPGYLLLAQHS